MAYFSNLEKKMNEDNKKSKISNSKIFAIVLTIIATIGYFSIFTNLVPFMKSFLLGTFGIFAYALFTTLFVVSGLILKGKKYHISVKYGLSLIFALISILAIFHMAFSNSASMENFGSYIADIYKMKVSVGGVVLGLIIYPLKKLLNFGAYILFAIVLIICVTVIYNGIAEAKSLSKINLKIFNNFKLVIKHYQIFIKLHISNKFLVV